MVEFIHLMEVYGIPLGLVIFFVWRDWQREKGLTARINQLQDYQKSRLETIAINSTAAITAVIDICKGFLDALNKMMLRPCISTDTIEENKKFYDHITILEADLNALQRVIAGDLNEKKSA